MQQKILKRLFLFLLFLLTWFDLTKFATIPVSKIGEPIPIFPQIQINLLQAKNKHLVTDAQQETAKMLLKYFMPQLAEQPWQTNFVFVDIIPDKEQEPEIVFALSLPPHKGVLVLLQKKQNHYFIVFVKDDLFPLAQVEVLPLKNGQNLLATKENQQKQIGSLGTSTLVKLWTWHENSLREVFTENTTNDINWQSPTAKQPKWYNLKQNLTITSSQANEQIKLKIQGKQQFSEAPVKSTTFPAPYDFPSPYSVLKSRDILQEYYWDQHWKKFIIKTGLYLPPGQNTPEEVAILKDLAQNLESLAFPEQPHYQVINKKGEIFPLPQASLFN